MYCDFIFCLHNHQPVGNFDHIFEWAFNNCYNKTMEIFTEYPDFRFAVHHSGPLLEWIKKHSPEYLHNLKKMSESGQAEIISGGFYEPIFSIITEQDIRGQITLMQNFYKEEFALSPKGFWTAERVWDPDIPRLISGLDLDYTLLDDVHFRYAGIEEKELFGYFLTERLDKRLKIFPIDKFLRYSIPFKSPEETIEYFKMWSERAENPLFIYGDDGEKFGVWPGTSKLVFEEKWLRLFIEAVLNENWIEMTLPSEYIETNLPKGRVYLTQGSYFELSEWALPAKAALKLAEINKEVKESNKDTEFYPFLKGGVWNNFLNKYPESNAINKRTLLLSREIERYEKDNNVDCTEEKIELYKAECNCAYWHGLFGGIYLGNIRSALYQHILKAEKLLLDKKNIQGIDILEQDFWNEGQNQILLRNKNQSTIIIPYMGGAISEIGIYNKFFNICNMLQRRFEAYHEGFKDKKNEQEEFSPEDVKSIHERNTIKNADLDKYLIFDESRRYSFKDLFFSNENISAHDIMFNKAEVYDCGVLKYNYVISKIPDGVATDLFRNIQIKNNNVSLSKRLLLSNNFTGVSAEYCISGAEGLSFGLELNINLLAGHSRDRFFVIDGVTDEFLYLDSIGKYEKIKSFAIIDCYNDFKIRVEISREVDLISYPVYTVNQSDAGFEKNFQGSSFILVNKLEGEDCNFNIKIKIE